jgi:uncharacterized protein YqiB (DUF1249 family)
MKQINHEPYSSIYKKLHTLIPNLEEHIAQGKQYGKSKLNSPAMMDLNFDYLFTDEKGSHVIALSHYFEQNGDLVPDPDMEIRIIPEMKMAEAMTFQDQRIYQHVYQHDGEKELVNPHLKKDMNYFLDQWLTNAIQQGHRIDLSKVENEQELGGENMQEKESGEPGKNNDLDDIRRTQNKNRDRDMDR